MRSSHYIDSGRQEVITRLDMRQAVQEDVRGVCALQAGSL